MIFFWFFLFFILNHVKETLRVDPKDYAFASIGVASLIYQIIGLVSYFIYESPIDFNLWINGSIASFLNLLGCVFSIASYATMASAGTISALISNN